MNKQPPNPYRWRLRAFAASFLLLLALTLLCLLRVEAMGHPRPPGTAVRAQVLRIPQTLKFHRRMERPQRTPETAEEAENERIEAALLAQAHVIKDCTVTHYDACAECCGKIDGITASGVQATPYVSVAVDPAIIPLGSDVLVDYGDGELHYYRADDIGAGVEGSHIDLCVNTYAEAVALGVRTATVYWIEPSV